MADIRRERFRSALLRATAEFLQGEMNPSPLITVIDCVLSNDLKHATIIVSVIPEKDSEQALSYLKRKRSDLFHYASDHMKTRAIPSFDFVLA